MLKRAIALLCTAVLLSAGLIGCNASQKKSKIGVFFAVGPAARWDAEIQHMEQRAEELGIEIDARLNREEDAAALEADCKDLIDSGIDVLIYTPRDASKASAILDYARQKKVRVINYARVVLGQKVDLFVGYDSNRIGQKMGQYLSEMVYQGDYIILSGDPSDNNATLLHDGAMRYLGDLGDSVRILTDTAVPGWSPDHAKTIVRDAIAANGNKVDAIFAPNDKIAGACAEVVAELGLSNHVVITGMDAELDAVRRIAAGTQDCTIYMNLQELAYTAVDEAYHMAMGQEVNVNTDFDNQSGNPISANLITGQLITRENIDSALIDNGYLTHEQVYGQPPAA